MTKNNKEAKRLVREGQKLDIDYNKKIMLSAIINYSLNKKIR